MFSKYIAYKGLVSRIVKAHSIATSPRENTTRLKLSNATFPLLNIDYFTTRRLLQTRVSICLLHLQIMFYDILKSKMPFNVLLSY